MGDSNEDRRTETSGGEAASDERQKEFTRRALLRAGWVAPLIATVNVPSAFAQSPVPTLGHFDHTDHVDVPHNDVAPPPPPHTDEPPPPHSDVTPHSDTLPHTDHADVPHSDHGDAPHQDHQDHQDAHADSHTDAHTDIHTDVHTDVPVPHSDVPHVDA